MSRLSRFGSLGESAYLGSVIFGGGSRIVSLGAQVFALFIMAWLLPKAEFGDMMTAFAVYRILSYGIGTGCAAIIVYHVARNATDDVELRTLRSFTVIGCMLAAILIGAMVFAAPAVSAMVGKPRIAFWLFHLAPFGLLSTLVTIAGGAYDGRHEINRSIFVVELVPNLARVIFLGVLFVVSAPTIWIAYALALAHLVSWLIIMQRMLSRAVKGFYRITRWDMGFTGRYILHSLLSLQLQGVDMVVVGWLFTSDVAADYAIAGRIAALFPFFQQIVLKKFAPRCGQLLAASDLRVLEREAAICRSSSVGAVAGLTGAMLILAPLILRSAGNFTSAITMLVALGAAPFVRSFFAGGEAILRMAGQASFNLAVMAGSFAFVVVTPLLTHQLLGIFALPLGMTLSALVLNPLIVLRVYRTVGIRLLEWHNWVLLVLGLGVFAASSHYASPDYARIVEIGIAIMALGGAGMALNLFPKLISKNVGHQF